ncbi:MAG TPA: hypothetical protein VFX25_20830 [Streptosporangiaceae bacterium]|nr:hypothetical protein [Streptosporangiaceae bacterium]
MQQLKMQRRTIVNTILDARVHGHGMTEPEAMALMSGRGYQEAGEVADLAAEAGAHAAEF